MKTAKFLSVALTLAVLAAGCGKCGSCCQKKDGCGDKKCEKPAPCPPNCDKPCCNPSKK